MKKKPTPEDKVVEEFERFMLRTAGARTMASDKDAYDVVVREQIKEKLKAILLSHRQQILEEVVEKMKNLADKIKFPSEIKGKHPYDKGIAKIYNEAIDDFILELKTLNK